MNFDEFSDLMLSRCGLFARMNRTASIRIMTLIAKEWEDKPLEPILRKKIRRLYKEEYGFDPLTWIIIGALVNVIVRMILEWIYDASDVDQRVRSNVLWKFKRELEPQDRWRSGDH